MIWMEMGMMTSLITAIVPMVFLGLTGMGVLILTKTAGQIIIHCIDLVMSSRTIGSKHLIPMAIHMEIIMGLIVVIHGMIPMQGQEIYSHLIRDNILIMTTMATGITPAIY